MERKTSEFGKSLHRDVCFGVITRKKARAGIAWDWMAAYRQLFGTP
jgi:hypothetical protein